MLNHEPVHQRFDQPYTPRDALQSGPETRQVSALDEPLTDHAAKVIFSTVSLYDAPKQENAKCGIKNAHLTAMSIDFSKEQPPKLSAAQRRRLRRKKGKEAQKIQSLESLEAATIRAEPIFSMARERNGDVVPLESAVPPEIRIEEESATQEARMSEKSKTLDYAQLKDLVGYPRKGIRIAYKTLEMTADYQPVVSDYNEALVMGLSADKQLVTLKKLNGDSKKGQKDPYAEDAPLGKFELPIDEPVSQEKSDIVTVDLLSLMSVKVLPN